MKKHVFIFLTLLFIPAITVFAENQERTKWPADLVNPDMPVYKGGRFKGWNQWDKNNKYSIFMVIENTGQADLDKYVIQLKSAGFEDKGNLIYQKDLYEVRLQFNSKTILQISSSRIKTAEWPKALLTGIPVPKGGALTNVLEPTEDMPGYLQLYFINFTRADVDTWLQELKKAGFSVEGDGASKSKVSLGSKAFKSLSIQLQENGTDEWMADFNYSD